jgi:hypothetical protein
MGKMSKFWMLTFVLMMCGIMSAEAQISAEVSELLKKVAAKMDHPSGTEVDMNVRAKMFIISVNMKMTVFSKGDKQRMKGTMKILGKTAHIESGFDGQQEWDYKHLDLKKENKKDTLYIKKVTKKSKADYDVDFGLDKSYRKATIKLKDKYHVITFTNPISKDDPKKVTVKVDTEKMLLREVSMKESIAKITMTVTRVKYGVSDNFFVLDTSKFPGAVIVRK